MKKSTIRKGSKVKFRITTAMKPKRTYKWVDGVVKSKYTSRAEGFKWKPAVRIKRGRQTWLKSMSEVKRR